jgi:Ca2+-transporting ATPase
VFGHRVARWVLVIAALLVVEGLVTDGFEHLGRIFLFAVALAVAAVPEGLPAILTSTLALGVERMARRRAVVRRLTAVEALGSVTVIATDKTGTLTENRMEVRVVDSPDPDRALDALLLANDADAGAGDPMDVALVAYGQSRLDVTALRAARPRVSARPFDAGQKFTRATVDEAGREVSYLKGAPEVLLGRSTLAEPDRRQWADRALGYAQDGFRVLGIAAGEGTREEALEFLGLVTFWDPPRPEVAEAIRRAREAGIRVLMITGDHPATARSIAAQVGIQGGHVLTGDEVEAMGPEAFAAAVADAHVFARVRPEHKLRLVEALQAAGAIVAVTGDGVNDAPALKKADVGVAMGQRGSDVSREVADLVLLDDNFATIVAAIEEGRSIYENVQKFIRFLFSTNLSEVIVVASGVLIAALLGLRDADGAVLLPLTAVQILWINLVTDGLPALSLALDRNPEVLQRGPREPSAPLLDRLSIEFVVSSGTVKAGMALAVLGLAFWGVLGREEARTATFHFMSVAQLFFAFPARHTDTRPLPNPTLVAAVVAGGLIQVLVGTVPQAASVLGCVLLPAWMWAGIIVLSLAAWGVAELVNRALWQGAPSRSRHAST